MQTSEPLAPSEKRQQWSWLAPVGALALGSAVAVWLDRSGAEPVTLASVYLLAGVGGGYGWQRLYPRDIADRFVMWAALLALGGLIGLLPGAELDDNVMSAPFAWLGVAAGVVLGEAHLRRRASVPQAHTSP